MVQFLRRGHLKAGNPHALRIDAIEHPPDDAILAAGIHCLQDNQHTVLVLGIEQLLVFLQLIVQLCQVFLGFFLVALIGGAVRRVELFQLDFLVGFHTITVHACLLSY